MLQIIYSAGEDSPYFRCRIEQCLRSIQRRFKDLKSLLDKKDGNSFSFNNLRITLLRCFFKFALCIEIVLFFCTNRSKKDILWLFCIVQHCRMLTTLSKIHYLHLSMKLEIRLHVPLCYFFTITFKHSSKGKFSMISQHKKFFWSVFSRIWTENTNQKKIRIETLFTQ